MPTLPGPAATQTVPNPTQTPAATESSTSSLPATPNPSSASPATPTVASSQTAKQCVDQAGYFGDVTVPDYTSFTQGTVFVKTWRFRNEGTCTWGPNYSLVFVKGDQLGGPTSVPLPDAKPGDVFDLSITLTAPAQGGSYMGVYEFQDQNGTKFGVNANGIDKFWFKISVVWLGATPGTTLITNPGGATACAGQEDSAFEAQVITLVNQARAQAGLPPLKANSKLSQAAYAHSLDMACSSSLSHTGSDGSLWYDRIKAQGYAYSYASENIYAAGPSFGGDPAGAMDWWMNSPVHKANILSASVTEIGVGYVYFSGSALGGYYTIDFAKP
jgi:uncharacterized protein YkwD